MKAHIHLSSLLYHLGDFINIHVLETNKQANKQIPKYRPPFPFTPQKKNKNKINK